MFLIPKALGNIIPIKERINAYRFMMLFVLFYFNTNVHGQEMRIWTQGNLTKIDTGIYVLPDIPVSTYIRYVEFSDFVLKVSNITVSDSIVDTVEYRVGGYPGTLTKVPARIAMVQIDSVYYRFTLDSINGVRCDFAGYDFFPDSYIESIKCLLWPDGLGVPKMPCLLWVDVEYTDCLTLREIVTKEMVFVNRFSDYCGSLKRGTHSYLKTASSQFK